MALHQKTVRIRQSIIDRVTEHPSNIAALIQDVFGISRQAANRHIRALVDEGVLVPHGNTSARTYELKILGKCNLSIDAASYINREDYPYLNTVKPLLENAPNNVEQLCYIGFTEMLNNAIEHSETESIQIHVMYTYASVRVRIIDTGVGIFRKIKRECGLLDEREAILEITKGKLTTSPKDHSGYGIFFTSRMVDVFLIHSGSHTFIHTRPDNDWMFEFNENEIEGTFIEFTIALSNNRTPQEVYAEFCGTGMDGDMSFSKTHVPLSLAQFGNERLVSRSQAKRVLSRFEKFNEVMLDFQGVDYIGQGFADEIFRVFNNAHPETKIVWVNANDHVKRMIGLAMSNSIPEQKRLFE